MREIGDILKFRQDISPFLVHLTRQRDEEGAQPAKDVLIKIIEDRCLRAGSSLVSDARFGYPYSFKPKKAREYFGAVCLTETPLSEVHCLLEIAYRKVNLARYGLVFLKDYLSARGVSPVLYLNNSTADQDETMYALASLIDTHSDAAKEILPLVAVFGHKITAPNAGQKQVGSVDFRWEREWRYPAARGDLQFDEDDVFVGICPHKHIDEFEALFPPVRFIDPTKNMKWYATQLIESRQRLDLAVSVV